MNANEKILLRQLFELKEDYIGTPASREKQEVLLKKAINKLPDDERQVIEMRYGLLDGQEYTVEEVAAKVGKSVEEVEKLEHLGLSRMRHP